MAEFWIGAKNGEFGLDEWSELLSRFPQFADRAISSALRSEGSRMQKLIKLEIRRGGPNGQRWPTLSPHAYPIRLAKERYREIQASRHKGVKIGKGREFVMRIHGGKHHEMSSGQFPLQKLAGAIRYAYDAAIKTATIGPLQSSWRHLFKQVATGYQVPVTPRMRKLLFAVGMPLTKETTVLNVPPRPVVGPVFQTEKQRIIANIQQKSIRNIYRYLTGKSKDQVEKDWTI